MIVIGCSHPGNLRSKNEDAYRIDPGRGLVVLADGLGGHPYGEIASEMAVQAVERFFTSPWADHHPFPDLLLPEAIFFAHATLADAVYENSTLQGMGTTLLIAWKPAGSNSIRLSHVGDSRAYLLRRGSLEQLTDDHVIMEQSVKAGGRLSAKEPAPAEHILVQAIGQGEYLHPSSLEMTLEQGDRLLLCTDGLTNEVPPEEIRAILTRPGSPEAACHDLLQAALENGGSDNITVAVISEN